MATVAIADQRRLLSRFMEALCQYQGLRVCDQGPARRSSRGQVSI